MEAKELRLGNFLQHGSSIVKVSAIHNDKLFIEVKPLKYTLKFDDTTYHSEPIKLTEEWFLKFGATKEIYEDDESDYYLVIRHDKFSIFYESDNCIYCDIAEEVFKLEYVHQLQNLYFALTGVELQLK